MRRPFKIDLQLFASKKYYSLVQKENEAHINIYGDITSWPWLESDVSSYTLAKEIEGLDVNTIHVYINSYGGGGGGGTGNLQLLETAQGQGHHI